MLKSTTEMSVSNNINKDTDWPQSQIPQPSVEEIKKWRCRKMNNGEQFDSALAVPVASPQQHKSTGEEGTLKSLSGIEEIMSSNKLSVSALTPRIYRTFYVRLAEESPKRNNNNELSDSSTYDSFNYCETEICRDSSDTDSNTSLSSGDVGGTIDVVEYEVASASNSDNFFTGESSSGADDILLAAVTICRTSKCSSDFADTEDSNTTFDSELSSADYWVCVKCKNKQNNPMYRYCEKCYQIRKTHFPPRPRLRKSRSAIKGHKLNSNSPSIKRSATSPGIGLDKTMKRRRIEEDAKANMPTSSGNDSLQNGSASTTGRLMLGLKPKQTYNSAESSTDEDDHIDFVNTNSDRANFVENSYHKYFPSCPTIQNIAKKSPAQRSRIAAKRKLSKDRSKYKTSDKKLCLEQNTNATFAHSDTEIETDVILSQPECGSSQSTQKDSGFSSAPSSQDRKSSSEPQNEEYEECISNCGGDSSDTVCGELNESDVAEMTEDTYFNSTSMNFDLPTQENSLDRRASDIVLPSNTDSHVISPLVQSLSECSDAYTNIQASSSNADLFQFSKVKQTELRSLQRIAGKSHLPESDPSYGSCMTCLTEPKNGVFVHSRFLHLCCCYKCAVKIWNKNKKCPICNCAVKNVMKLFVY